VWSWLSGLLLSGLLLRFLIVMHPYRVNHTFNMTNDKTRTRAGVGAIYYRGKYRGSFAGLAWRGGRCFIEDPLSTNKNKYTCLRAHAWDTPLPPVLASNTDIFFVF